MVEKNLLLRSEELFPIFGGVGQTVPLASSATQAHRVVSSTSVSLAGTIADIVAVADTRTSAALILRRVAAAVFVHLCAIPDLACASSLTMSITSSGIRRYLMVLPRI